MQTSVLFLRLKLSPPITMPSTVARESMSCPMLEPLLSVMGIVIWKDCWAICPKTVLVPLTQEVFGQTLKLVEQQSSGVNPLLFSTAIMLSTAVAKLLIAQATLSPFLLIEACRIAQSGLACTCAAPTAEIVLQSQHWAEGFLLQSWMSSAQAAAARRTSRAKIGVCLGDIIIIGQKSCLPFKVSSLNIYSKSSIYPPFDLHTGRHLHFAVGDVVNSLLESVAPCTSLERNIALRIQVHNAIHAGRILAAQQQVFVRFQHCVGHCCSPCCSQSLACVGVLENESRQTDIVHRRKVVSNIAQQISVGFQAAHLNSVEHTGLLADNDRSSVRIVVNRIDVNGNSGDVGLGKASRSQHIASLRDDSVGI